MGACLATMKRLFQKPVAEEEYIYLPARSPKRPSHTPKAKAVTSHQPVREVVAQEEEHYEPPTKINPEVLRKQHDELIEAQSNFIHLKLSVENLVRENKQLGADDGSYFFVFC